jgi:nitrogen fixation NifU-like protein
MSSLEALYQDILLDHHRSPRNFGELDSPQMKAEGFNPMCGDRVCVQLNLENEKIVSRFKAEACSICLASASLMTEEIEGLSCDEAKDKINKMRQFMQGAEFELEGDLSALSGVRRFPVRIKCALLPWTTLKEAIDAKA